MTSTLHQASDGKGRPLAFVVTGGKTNDCTRFTAVLEAIRARLRRRGIPHTTPERADQVRNRARRGSRGAARCDKTAESCEAAVALASLCRHAYVER